MLCAIGEDRHLYMGWELIIHVEISENELATWLEDG